MPWLLNEFAAKTCANCAHLTCVCLQGMRRRASRAGEAANQRQSPVAAQQSTLASIINEAGGGAEEEAEEGQQSREGLGGRARLEALQE